MASKTFVRALSILVCITYICGSVPQEQLSGQQLWQGRPTVMGTHDSDVGRQLLWRRRKDGIWQKRGTNGAKRLSSTEPEDGEPEYGEEIPQHTQRVLRDKLKRPPTRGGKRATHSQPQQLLSEDFSAQELTRPQQVGLDTTKYQPGKKGAQPGGADGGDALPQAQPLDSSKYQPGQQAQSSDQSTAMQQVQLSDASKYQPGQKIGHPGADAGSQQQGGSGDPALTGNPGEGVPVDFNWQHYIKMYPELKEFGITDEAHAKYHYKTAGKTEGRLHALPVMYLQYAACTQVFEQLYSHMAAMAIGSQLGAGLVMPPALTKDEQGMWNTVPLSTILNFKRTRKNAKAAGIALFKVPDELFGYLPRDVLWHGSTDEHNRDAAVYNPDLCHPRWRWVEVPESRVIQFENVFEAIRSLDDIVAEIYTKVGKMAVEEFKAGARKEGEPSKPIILSYPCTYFAIHSFSALGVMQQMAGLLAWPKRLVGLAQKAVQLLREETGAAEFNGIMLRGHDDWLTFTTTQFPTIYFKYVKAMRSTFGEAPLPCYFGIEDLIDITDQGMKSLEHYMVHSNKTCSMVITKFGLLDDEDLEGMHAEQYKLLDFLMLLEAKHVISHYKALAGVFLNEYRHMMFQGQRTMTRVQTQIIVDRLPREFDKLILGGLYTARHSRSVQDLPQLFIGDGQAKMDTLLKRQRAARLKKLTDDERARIGLPPKHAVLTDEQKKDMPEDYWQ